MRTKRMYLVAAALTVAACQESAGPAEPVQPVKQANLQVSEACYSPRFHVTSTLVLPPTLPFTWVGVVSGDLVGTAVQVFDVEPVVLNPYNIVAMQTVSWDITDGVIPELVGRQFQTRGRFHSVPTPDHDSAALNQSHEQALAGIRLADLTAHGRTDGFPPVSQLDYQGLICP